MLAGFGRLDPLLIEIQVAVVDAGMYDTTKKAGISARSWNMPELVRFSFD